MLRVFVVIFLLVVSFGCMSSSMVLVGGTIVDGKNKNLLHDSLVIIKNGRISRIGVVGEVTVPEGYPVHDVTGKYIIPGLMDANVHLLLEITLETLARYENQYDQLIIEATQIALKNGITTVFDSWGPLEDLMLARDRINANEVVGSRIFLAGNIIGFGGPFSTDFFPIDGFASQSFIDRINARWEVGVGRDLLFMTPDKVAESVESYLENNVDFVKYGSSGHSLDATRLIAFSPTTQKQIIAVAHNNKKKIQSHSTSIESLRLAVESGVDILQHCESTGPTLIPPDLIQMIREKNIYCATLTLTKKRRENLVRYGGKESREFYKSYDVGFENTKNMIDAGVKILLSSDGSVFSDDAASHPIFINHAGQQDDVLIQLGKGHINWFKAVQEAGMQPWDMLNAATINIAEAYGIDDDLGAVAEGKIADFVVLNSNPLDRPENYSDIKMVIKNGVEVDRSSLPTNPLLTR